MIYFTCDICGRRIAADQKRYRVTIEVELRDAYEDDEDEEEFFEDDVEEVPEEEDKSYQQFRFDLCEECAASYIANPLPFGVQRFRINDN
jgi:hypothetical protein